MTEFRISLRARVLAGTAPSRLMPMWRFCQLAAREALRVRSAIPAEHPIRSTCAACVFCRRKRSRSIPCQILLPSMVRKRWELDMSNILRTDYNLVRSAGGVGPQGIRPEWHRVCGRLSGERAGQNSGFIPARQTAHLFGSLVNPFG